MTSPVPTPVLPLLDGNTLLVDNSSMESFQTCPRLAEYTISRRLRPSGDRVPLRFGGIVHRVLEARYRCGLPLYEQTPSVTASMIAIADQEFSTWQPPDGDHRNYDTCVSLIQKYGIAYPYESFEIVPLGDHPAIEVPFALPLGVIPFMANAWVQDITRDAAGHLTLHGEPYHKYLDMIHVTFSGKIDMIYRDQGGHYILDHKTASIATNMAEFELSHQFSGYVWAAENLLSTPIHGICINRIVVRKPSRTGEAFTFERKLIPVQRGTITEWRNDMLYMIADFVEMVRRGYLPKHTVWCVGKYGTCPFHRVCLLDSPEQREILLRSGDFESNTWTPLNT